MSLRHLVTAAALSCALAACNTTGATLGSAVGSTVGTVVGAQIDPSTIGTVQRYVTAACRIAPAVASIQAVADAIARSGAAVTATEIGSLLCDAFALKSAFAADAPTPPARPAKPRKGETVQGTAIVNGKPVPVTGTAK